jgi:hypothetical protein
MDVGRLLVVDWLVGWLVDRDKTTTKHYRIITFKRSNGLAGQRNKEATS